MYENETEYLFYRARFNTLYTPLEVDAVKNGDSELVRLLFYGVYKGRYNILVKRWKK